MSQSQSRFSNRYSSTRSQNRFNSSQSQVRINEERLLQDEEIRMQRIRDEEFRLQQQRMREEEVARYSRLSRIRLASEQRLIEEKNRLLREQKQTRSTTFNPKPQYDLNYNQSFANSAANKSKLDNQMIDGLIEDINTSPWLVFTRI